MKDTIAFPAAPAAAADNRPLEAYCTDLRAAHAPSRRILLVQIPQVILHSFNREIALQRGYYAFPPTGLQCLHEAIRHRAFEVRILDLNFELLKRVFEDEAFDPNDWTRILDEALADFQPYVVGVSCLFDMAIGPMLAALRRIRASGAVVVSGGVIATYEADALLSRELSHFVVRGEGENKFNFLLDHLMRDGVNSAPTPGIQFRAAGGLLESAGSRDIVEVKGDLRASYDLVRIEEYHRYGSLNPFSRQGSAAFAAIQMSRGCRAECTFCAVRDFMGKGVRHRPIEDVLAEMAFLVEIRGVRHFEWLDDDPTFHRAAFQELLRRIIARGWNIQWSANNGVIAASIDDETLRLMRDSGCIGFKVGIETGNEEMLRTIRKPARHYKFLELADKLRRYPEIFCGGNFMVGLPRETFAQMMDSFRFALEVELDWAAITVCQVIRGASAFSESGEYFEHQVRTGGSTVRNFIPARESAAGQVKTDAGVLRNLAVFRLDPASVPGADQVKEIWFTFNLIVNYACNKNLRPDGNPEKFIRWVQTAQRAYPTNPYMMLFLGLAHRLRGEDSAAIECRGKAREFSRSDYWRDRFHAFRLDPLLENFPATREDVFAALAALHDRLRPAYRGWLDAGRGAAPKTAA